MRGMPRPSKKLERPNSDLWTELERAMQDDRGSAAAEHLAAGFPIYYSNANTPAGALIKEYPDGRRELVRFDRHGEHRIAA